MRLALHLPSLGLLVAVGMLAASAVAACSSTNVTVVRGPAEAGTEAGLPDPDLDAGTPDAEPESDGATTSGDTNPYGAAYPTKNLGKVVRGASSPGSVLPNLKLTGYAPGATVTSQVSMANVYDPEGRTHDIVAVLIEGMWDVYSIELMNDLKMGVPARVALFVALAEGTTPGTAATKANLDVWHMEKNLPTAWYGLDSTAQFPALDVAALPGVVVLDARTMEIVSAAAGKPSNPKQDLEAAAAVVKARPPAY